MPLPCVPPPCGEPLLIVGSLLNTPCSKKMSLSTHVWVALLWASRTPCHGPCHTHCWTVSHVPAGRCASQGKGPYILFLIVSLNQPRHVVVAHRIKPSHPFSLRGGSLSSLSSCLQWLAQAWLTRVPHQGWLTASTLRPCCSELQSSFFLDNQISLLASEH